MKPYEELTEEDIRNIKSSGSGCGNAIVTIIISVVLILFILHFLFKAI